MKMYIHQREITVPYITDINIYNKNCVMVDIPDEMAKKAFDTGNMFISYCALFDQLYYKMMSGVIVDKNKAESIYVKDFTITFEPTLEDIPIGTKVVLKYVNNKWVLSE